MFQASLSLAAIRGKIFRYSATATACRKSETLVAGGLWGLQTVRYDKQLIDIVSFVTFV